MSPKIESNAIKTVLKSARHRFPIDQLAAGLYS